MRGLTLTEPWATLVTIGAKRFETRSWKTSYRGAVAIHASKSYPAWARELRCVEPFRSTLSRLDPSLGPLGCVLCVAQLVDCRQCDHDTPAQVGEPEASFGDFAPGRFRFELADVHPLVRPIALRGALGLWTIPRVAEARILTQAGLL